ncbi:MAG: DUF86 domain-containing protein [Chitinivibrionales bacterium]|nr:DUF86 domain-containing protein [Chitinivibrionales bacterium]
MIRAVKLFVGDIVENMRLVSTLIEGMDFNAFINDKRTHNAVIRCIEVIGEATKNIPDKTRGKYPSVPWKDMAGMRDVVIHFYMGVDFRIVWEVIKKRYPVLLVQIERIYNEIEN